MNTKIEIGNHSDVGRIRSANEDYYGSYEGAFGNLLVVCDGMGGHIGGQEASRIAVDSIKNHFLKLNFNFDASKEIYQAIVKANKNILVATQKNPDLTGMGSTTVLLLIKDGQVYYAHVGDSRIYMIRENQIHQLTKDHSLIQKLIDSGIVAKENAASYPNKNVIVKALGEKELVEPDIVGPMTIFKGDRFILCSDGLTTYLSNDEILKLSFNNKSQKAAKKLVDTANERGGKDNITVQIIDIIKGRRLPNKKLLKLRDPKIILSVLVVAIFSLATVFISKSLFSTENFSKKSKDLKEISKEDDTTKSSQSIDTTKSSQTQSSDTNKSNEQNIQTIVNNKKDNTSKVDADTQKKKNKSKYEEYIVKDGDTIYGIAIKFKVKSSELMNWNNLKEKDVIKPGRSIKIFRK